MMFPVSLRKLLDSVSTILAHIIKAIKAFLQFVYDEFGEMQ